VGLRGEKHPMTFNSATTFETISIHLGLLGERNAIVFYRKLIHFTWGGVFLVFQRERGESSDTIINAVTSLSQSGGVGGRCLLTRLQREKKPGRNNKEENNGGRKGKER